MLSIHFFGLSRLFFFCHFFFNMYFYFLKTVDTQLETVFSTMCFAFSVFFLVPQPVICISFRQLTFSQKLQSQSSVLYCVFSFFANRCLYFLKTTLSSTCFVYPGAHFTFAPPLFLFPQNSWQLEKKINREFCISQFIYFLVQPVVCISSTQLTPRNCMFNHALCISGSVALNWSASLYR